LFSLDSYIAVESFHDLPKKGNLDLGAPVAGLSFLKGGNQSPVDVMTLVFGRVAHHYTANDQHWTKIITPNGRDYCVPKNAAKPISEEDLVELQEN